MSPGRGRSDPASAENYIGEQGAKNLMKGLSGHTALKVLKLGCLSHNFTGEVLSSYRSKQTWGRWGVRGDQMSGQDDRAGGPVALEFVSASWSGDAQWLVGQTTIWGIKPSRR